MMEQTINQHDSSHYHIPVIIVSAQGTSDVIIEAKKRGAAGFVVKPISPNILLDKVSQNIRAKNKKASKESLVRILSKLSSACVIGKSAHVEKIVKNLKHVYFERLTDIEIASICSYAIDMEYNRANEMVMQLLKSLQEE